MKKILSVLVALCMVLTMTPAVFAAESEASSAEDLQAAIESAANGDTIKLTENVTASIVIPAGKTLTLDLNGCTLTGDSSYAIKVTGNLTIKDSATGGTVTNNKETNQYHAVNVDALSKGDGVSPAMFTLESGTIRTEASSKNAVCVNGSSAKVSGKFTMNGGKLEANSGTTNYGGAALSVKAYGEAQVNGGTIENLVNKSSDTYYAVNASANSYFTINGGIFLGYVKNLGKNKTTGGSYSVEPYAGGLAEGYFSVYNPETGLYTLTNEAPSESNAVASLTVEAGTTYYWTSKAALAAASESGGGTITLLKNDAGNLSIPANQTVTLDLNGKELLGSVDVAKGAAFIVKDSTAGVPSVSGYEVEYSGGMLRKVSGAYTVKVLGELTVESGKIINDSLLGDDKFGASTAVVAYSGGKVNIENGYITGKECAAKVYGEGSVLNITGGVLEGTDNFAVGNFGTDTGAHTITISGGTVLGHVETDGYLACGVYQVSANGTVNITGDAKILAENGTAVRAYAGVVNIDGGKISASGAASGKVGDTDIVPASAVSASGGAVVDIKSGYFTSDKSVSAVSQANGTGGRVTVTGGYYSAAPSEFIVPGYTAAESDVAGYACKVGKINENVAVSEGAGKAGYTPENAEFGAAEPGSGVDQAAVEAAAGQTESKGLANATDEKVAAVTPEHIAEAGQALETNEIEIPGEKEVVVVVQPYLQVTPQGSTMTETEKTVKFDIEPKYNLIATHTGIDTTNPENIITEGDGQNAVVLNEEPLDLTVTTPVTVTLTLPDSFAGIDTTVVYVKHEADAGVFWYTCPVEEGNKITFTTKHGFSPVTISTVNEAEAELDGTGCSLQYAVDNVQNGGEIKIVKDGAEATVRRTVNFTVIPNEKIYTINLGSRYKDKNDDPDVFEVFYEAPASRPDEPSEPPVIQDKCDGGASCPAHRFADLDLSEWYHDGIHYCVEKGLMKGTDKTVFTPYGTTTRGMVAAILYRIEKEPGVEGDCPFTDVESGFYYEDAITWAAANGIVTGYSDSQYGPEDAITREQMAAILYRYAQYKGMDAVTPAENLSSFADADSISEYAVSAMNWAVGAALIKGDGNQLMPAGNAERCQVAAILTRFCENFVK